MVDEVLELYGPWFRHPDGRWVDASEMPKEENPMSYDQRSHDLAETFIGGTPLGTDEHMKELAQLIQTTIEDWIVAKEAELDQ